MALSPKQNDSTIRNRLNASASGDKPPLGLQSPDKEVVSSLPNGMPAGCAGPSFFKAVLILALVLIIPSFVGLALAKFVVLSPTFNSSDLLASYAVNVAALSPDKGYLLLAVLLLSKTMTFLNMYPAIYWKPQVMPQNAGNLRANMQIFKIIGSDAPKNACVVLETEGALGAYNRANRSLTHMVENSLSFLAGIAVCGMLYPFAVFVLTSGWCIGRVMHQVGYSVGYGSHAAGAAISSMASLVLEGLLLFTAIAKLTGKVGL